MVLSTTRPNGLSSTLRMRSDDAVAGAGSLAPLTGAGFLAAAPAKATVRVKVVPPPLRCVTLISPPIERASCLTDDSPSPAPPKRDAIETLAWENGRNRRLTS